MANLSHLRHFGLIIKRLNVDRSMYEEDSFKLMLLLIYITERLMAPIIEEYELDSLEEDIILYLDLRKKIHQEYPSMMEKAKPNITTWFIIQRQYQSSDQSLPIGLLGK